MDAGMRGQRGVQRWLPITVIALGVVAGLLLAIVLLTRPSEPDVGLGSPSPSLDATPGETPATTASAGSSTAASTDSPVPSATPMPTGPAQLAWADGPSREGSVGAITRVGDRWLAGGSAVIGDKWWAAVWTSADGLTWSEPIAVGPEPEGVDASQGWAHRINAFAEFDGQIVAFGNRTAIGSDTLAAMMWRSSDGEAWEFVDTAGTAYGDEWHVPLEATATPQGGLAVHSLINLGSGAKAYVTDDLVSWESNLIADEEAASTAVSTAMTASPDMLIAVGWLQGGYEEGETPTVTAHVWTSPDARTWTEVGPPAVNAWLTGVAWDEVRERFVVIGTDAEGLPMAWLTAGGSSWTTIPLGDEPMQQMRVSASDGLIAASGVAGPLGEAQTGPTVVWSSHDGVSWWYGSVLNRPSYAVLTALDGSAILIDNRSEFPGGRWVPLVGTVADGD